MKEIVLFLYLLILSIFDWREKRVPAALLAGGVVLAAAAAAFGNCLPDPGNPVGRVAELLSGMIPGSFLLLLAWLTQKIGWGDGMALIIVGLLHGFRAGVVLLCLSMLLTALVGIALLLFRKAGRQTELPYLPFLAAAYLAGMFL